MKKETKNPHVLEEPDGWDANTAIKKTIVPACKGKNRIIVTEETKRKIHTKFADNCI